VSRTPFRACSCKWSTFLSGLGHDAVTPSWFVEDYGGHHQPIPTVVGAGKFAMVCRAATCVAGTWSRPSLGETTRYLDGTGKPIALAPGVTWVELVPDNRPVAIAGGA